MVFDKQWFQEYQRILVWLLNAPILKYWFRWVLRIQNKERINRIEPNAYWFGAVKKENRIEVKADFRTHNKYAKRLYYGFKPLWWMLHFWDWLIADKFIPELSFGFLTLTVYPDASTGGTTVDGIVYRELVAESFATLRAAAGNAHAASNATNDFADLTSFGAGSTYDQLQRSIYTFDTSPLTSSAVISAATFSFFGTAKSDQLSQSLAVSSASPASNNNLVDADFNLANFGTTNFATQITIASFSTTAYNDFALNASGIANISLTGISKFGGRLSCDIDNSAPTYVVNQVAAATGYFADQAATTNDPKLVITYTLVVASSAGSSNLTLLGVG